MTPSIHTCTQSGVVIALSGFKNPFRGELREKALEMGAKYEADWGPSCTHLMYVCMDIHSLKAFDSNLLIMSFLSSCAFANTPKFNQVKGACTCIY